MFRIMTDAEIKGQSMTNAQIQATAYLLEPTKFEKLSQRTIGVEQKVALYEEKRNFEKLSKSIGL